MCLVPGSASQDAVFKRVYASPGLQCGLMVVMFIYNLMLKYLKIMNIFVIFLDAYSHSAQGYFTLRQVSWRRVNLCTRFQEVECIFASSFKTWSESLRQVLESRVHFNTRF
jgi:hypothetical protein